MSENLQNAEGAGRFYPLEVIAIERSTSDSAMIALRPREADKARFRFLPGQYLTFRRTINGEELRRSYSICSGPQDDSLKVGVKKVEDGWFSGFVNDQLCVGETLEAMVPAGRFVSEASDPDPRHVLAFAGGSGITPILAIMKSVLVTEPASRFTLFYANRSIASIMFRAEIADLKNRYMDRLALIHILEEGAADADLLQGRLDAARCARLLDSWIAVETVNETFICGPQPMMIAVRDTLVDRGVSEGTIRIELFANAPRRGPAKTKRSLRPDRKAQSVDVTLDLDGARHRFAMAAESGAVLDAALEAGIDVPYSCQAGVCATCRARIVSGAARMATNHVLDDDEVARGFILTCQAIPESQRLEIDYDIG